jgi:hypothetical protein
MQPHCCQEDYIPPATSCPPKTSQAIPQLKDCPRCVRSTMRSIHDNSIHDAFDPRCVRSTMRSIHDAFNPRCVRSTIIRSTIIRSTIIRSTIIRPTMTVGGEQRTKHKIKNCVLPSCQCQQSLQYQHGGGTRGIIHGGNGGLV